MTGAGAGHRVPHDGRSSGQRAPGLQISSSVGARAHPSQAYLTPVMPRADIERSFSHLRLTSARAFSSYLLWRPIEETMKLLPGPHSETKKGGFSRGPDSLSGGSSNINKVTDGRRSLVLVIFLGGVTFAEIAALRFLSAQEGMAYDIIVGTTKIVSGHTLLDTFVEKMS